MGREVREGEERRDGSRLEEKNREEIGREAGEGRRNSTCDDQQH